MARSGFEVGVNRAAPGPPAGCHVAEAANHGAPSGCTPLRVLRHLEGCRSRGRGARGVGLEGIFRTALSPSETATASGSGHWHHHEGL